MTITLPAAIIGGVFGFALWAFFVMILMMVASVYNPGVKPRLHPSTPGWIISCGAVTAIVFHVMWG